MDGKKVARPFIFYRSKFVLWFAVVALSLPQAIPVRAQASWMHTETRAHPTGNAIYRRNLRDSETVDIVVGLRLRNPDKLDRVIASQNTSGDLGFRRWLTSDQVAADYLPTDAQANAVANYLVRSGFTDIQITSNRLLVSATGSAAAVRTAFNTDLAYFERNGKEGIANLADANVPSELGDTVLSVLGLQTLDVPHIGIVTPHDPIAFPTIYDASGLPSAANTAVGIITEGSMTQPIADLHTFEAENGLPTINPTVVNVGGTSTDTSNLVEWDLDSQTIQAQAGGTIKQMLFYTATSLNDAPLTATYNRAMSDNIATIINVSIGACETPEHSSGAMAQDDAIFKIAVAQGQTFSAASGDSGSDPCGAGTVDYPASSSYVIAVGGTTLSTNSNGTYASEVAWSLSGGGPSAFEPQPNWQSGIVPGTARGVPDLAFDADPNSGAQIVVSGVLQTWGGTSLASPLFVGSFARLQSAHSNSLGFPAGWIYQYGSQRPAPAFHDVVSGSNGSYTAGVGWDFVTGWGSIDVAALATAISGFIYDKPTLTAVDGGGVGYNGFVKGLQGSMSPATTSNGYTYQAFADRLGNRGTGYQFTIFSVSGFAADPSAAWLDSATAAGVTLRGATATYSYSSGTATWKWILAVEPFNTSSTETCWIAHK